MPSASLTTTLLLARHGRVAEPWRARLYGDLDVPLAPEGERQALALRDRLADVPLAAVVSSGLARAEYGARLLREPRGLPRRDEPDLGELRRGEWRGLERTELERRWPGALAAWLADPHERRPPGGESLGDLARRVLPCIERLARERAGGSIALVAHTWVARVVVCRALGLPAGEARHFFLPSGALVALDWPASEAPGALADPVLTGFALDRLPDPDRRWNRGPRRPLGGGRAGARGGA